MKKMTKMKGYIALLSSVFLFFLMNKPLYAQNLNKQKRLAQTHLREGNKLYQKQKYADAEIAYKKALANYPDSPKSIYNTANAIYRQKRYKEAIEQYQYLAKNANDNALKAAAYHNIGNAYMQLKNYQKAVAAYKNSLRKNPTDEKTRYNLALAQKLLKNQQNKNNKNKNKNKNKNNKNKKDKNKDDKKNKDKKNQDKKDKNKDKKKNKDEKDKNKKDKNKDDKKNKDKKDQDKKDKNKDDKKNPNQKQNKNEDKKDKKEKQAPQPGKLSPQQVQQLLQALQNEEKKTQDKMNAKKVKGVPVKTDKDW